MVRVGVKIVETSKGCFEIIKERGDSKDATEIETVLGNVVEKSLQVCLAEIMEDAERHGAKTSREVRRG